MARRAKKGTPEINSGSMADISFLLLSFFLMTSNMDQSSGLQRRLPPMPQDDGPKVENDANKVKARNLFQVKINSWDGLFAGGRPMDVSMLRQEVKEFIKNTTNDENKPDKKKEIVPGLGEVLVSEAVISLQNDRGTSYKTYILVQNELVAAYNELREEFAKEHFNGRSFSQLTEAEQEIITKTCLPQRISEAEPKDVTKKK